MKTRYIWPFKQTWYSICNRHWYHDTTCNMCEVGQWHFNVIRVIDRFVHAHMYNLWFWWHNRPNSKTMKFIKKIFSNAS